MDIPNLASITNPGAIADVEINVGYEMLGSSDWSGAEAHFRSVLALRETPEAWEGLGLALWWRNDLEEMFSIRERAYALYRAAGNRRGAGRVALWLAWDYLGILGQMAVANGWMQRAHNLLDDLHPCGEQGWLALRESENAILWDNDPVTARALAAKGADIGRALGLIDLEMFGLALEGFTLVSEGKVDQGMRRLDEATAAAISGEMSNVTAIGATCCCLIFACERVYDYDRALQWCERLKDYCERISYVPLLGVCRSHYAGMLLWSGAWKQAEEELAEATRILQATRPAFLAEAIVRQGFLRFQQGRLDEAVLLFEQSSYFPHAQLGLGQLALDLGEAESALDYARRYLRQIPTENLTTQVEGLELMARAHLALANFDEAKATCDKLAAIAREVETAPLLAISNLITGLVAAATGDHDSARNYLEDASDLFARSSAPYEMGRARLALARSLGSLGRLSAAEREAQVALQAFRELGAERQVAHAEALLHHLQHLRNAPSAQEAGSHKLQLLSERQLEVLKLIAQGRGDQEIADWLSLSPHTVHRHVTNILSRLDVSSRAAAVAYAAREGLL
ncbi:MAG: LuxR C-terminal-related transcriptional regulator [Chloroflexota bacterium]